MGALRAPSGFWGLWFCSRSWGVFPPWLFWLGVSLFAVFVASCGVVPRRCTFFFLRKRERGIRCWTVLGRGEKYAPRFATPPLPPNGMIRGPTQWYGRQGRPPFRSDLAESLKTKNQSLDENSLRHPLKIEGAVCKRACASDWQDIFLKR